MKRFVWPVALVFTASLSVSCTDNPVQPPSDVAPRTSQFGSGRYVVALTGNDVDRLRSAVTELGGTLDFAHAEAGMAVVSGLTPDAAAALERTQGVSGVLEDLPVHLVDVAATTPRLAAGPLVNSPDPSTAFLFSWQWYMRRVGANVAWAAGRLGSPDVSVAIIDSGIDTENLDMEGRVDLTRSVSLMPSDDAFIDTWLPTRPKIEDLDGHGTLVANVVATNAVVFAGVTSRVTLLAIKVLDRNGDGTISSILIGLIRAADFGADVANMSLRLPGGVDKRGVGFFVGLSNRIFNYAYRKGVVVVLVAGNEAENLDGNGDIYRAWCDAPHVICVSATGPTASADPFIGPWQNEDALASYSNYGRMISVSAPGGTIPGRIWSICPRYLVTGYVPNTNPAQPIFGCLTPTPNTAFITGGGGTSLAAPHVSGLAALLIEDLGKNNPAAIKHAILHRGVDDLGARGDDPLYGAGRINIPRALGLQ